MSSPLQKGRKSTQRRRLLTGMVTVANRDGYANANVSAVIAAAGVSRPTFYDYFGEKDDCFLAALADIQERLAADVSQACSEQAPERALQAAVGALVSFAASEPAQARLVMSEAMAAGPRALQARDDGIGQIEDVVEESLRRAPQGAAVVDLCPRIVLGGIQRLLASRLRRGEPGIAGLDEELQRWIESYVQEAGEQRWRTLEPTAAARGASTAALSALPGPGPLPPGRPGLTREQVAENHRQRILYAAARLAEEKGYNATTIADITRLAGVDGRAFYAAFTDKQDAFMTVHELGVQQVMDAAAGGFFTGANWPERIWESGLALTRFLESNPMITHVGFVEAAAVGPGAVQRVEDSHVTFTIFLQEGYQHESEVQAPSRLALEAIITSIFEIVYRQARASAQPEISGLLGHLAFLSLAPFLGPGEANRFIDGKLAREDD